MIAWLVLESCSHVASLLWAIEAGCKRRDSLTVTDKKAYGGGCETKVLMRGNTVYVYVLFLLEIIVMTGKNNKHKNIF